MSASRSPPEAHPQPAQSSQEIAGQPLQAIESNQPLPAQHIIPQVIIQPPQAVGSQPPQAPERIEESAAPVPAIGYDGHPDGRDAFNSMVAATSPERRNSVRTACDPLAGVGTPK